MTKLLQKSKTLTQNDTLFFIEVVIEQYKRSMSFEGQGRN